MESDQLASNTYVNDSTKLKNDYEKNVKKLELKPVLNRITKTRMPFILGDRYRIVVFRSSRKKGIYSSAVEYDGKICHIEEFMDVDGLADGFRGCEDHILAVNADAIANAIFEHIKNWSSMVAIKELGSVFTEDGKKTSMYGRKLHNIDDVDEDKFIDMWINNVSSVVKSLREIYRDREYSSDPKKALSKKLKEFEDILSGVSRDNIDLDFLLVLIKTLFGETLTEVFELIVTCGLTLRFVDRDRGLVGNRPDWLLLISPPSTLKTTMMDMIKDSPYVFYIDDVTAASFLPADPMQEPLILNMHGKVTLFPSLSIIAQKSDDEAKNILAILERIYDGEYRRGTAKSTRGLPVDTVVIGALTPDVFEHAFLQKMISYGSRYLFYRYSIPDYLALSLGHLFDVSHGAMLINHIRALSNHLFTYAMNNVNINMLQNVVIPPEYEKDLDVLSVMMARLRVVFYRRVEYVEDEDQSGRIRYRRVESMEITQRDAPLRSYRQLSNFVRSNVFVRKSPRFLGYPQIDRHAMKLASKLAISSSYRYFSDIILYLLRKHDVASISSADIANMLKVSRTTAYRYIDVLFHLGILNDTATPRLDETYFKTLSKYLLSDGDGGDGE